MVIFIGKKSNLFYYGTGRRKTSIARVFIFIGSGKFFVNKVLVDSYFFNCYRLINIVYQPLNLLSVTDIFNLYVTVKGGGLNGQAESIRLGISRALIKYNILFKKELKKNGYITRDSRKVERKKVGLHKSRKKHQYSKR